MIDSRVGCLLDGAVVYFKDGHKTPCGPRWSHRGGEHSFGENFFSFPNIFLGLTFYRRTCLPKIKIPEGVDVVKVEVGHNGGLNGLRFHLSDGTAGGYLYKHCSSHALGKCHLSPSHPDDFSLGFRGSRE